MLLYHVSLALARLSATLANFGTFDVQALPLERLGLGGVYYLRPCPALARSILRFAPLKVVFFILAMTPSTYWLGMLTKV